MYTSSYSIKNIFVAVLIMFTAIELSGCTKGGDLLSADTTIYTISGDATSQQLVPAGAGLGTAAFSGWYDEGQNVLTITLNWSNLFATGADAVTGINLYGPAAAGANGTLTRTVNFASTAPSGTVTIGLAGSSSLLPGEKADFLGGSWYYVVCTKNFPNGIARGQLTSAKR
jgi:hypothetical protein